jgi:hypothetical protein
MAKKTKANRTSWFDEKSHHLLLDQHAQKLDPFLKAMADGKVDAKELHAQEERLVALMKEVEPLLDDTLHEKVTQLLCELVAYDQMQMVHTMQEARPKGVFRG